MLIVDIEVSHKGSFEVMMGGGESRLDSWLKVLKTHQFRFHNRLILGVNVV